MMRVPRGLMRTAAVATGTAAAVVLLALPALAHVTITPNTVQAGSAAVLTFHVPNEEANADTVRIDVQIPTSHPIADVLVAPVPGWSISVKTVTLAKPLVTDDGRFTQAVSEVIWSGGKILPGQFQDFEVSADPLPTGIPSLTFKAIQTYSNGDIVRWIDVAQPGQPQPDHPAPVLSLTTATPTVHTGAAPAGSAPQASGSDSTARMLSGAALAVGVLALAVVALTMWRGRVTGD